MTRLSTVLFLTALGANSAWAQEIVGRRESSYTITERLETGDFLRVASPNGRISVTQGRGSQVEIRADKTVRRGSVEDIGFVVRKGSEGLTVCAVYEDEDECGRNGEYHGHDLGSRWQREHQLRVDFTIRIPDGVKVRVATGNGDVSVTGAGSDVNASTGNGAVMVSNTVGTVHASSGNGKVTIEGAEGPVEVSTGNGEVYVMTSTGPVNATSGNGDIEVSMDRLPSSSDMSFSTGNGRITVTVPEGFDAELDSHTGSGKVLVDFPIQVRGRIDPSRIRGTIGRGGGRLTLSSGNGDLEIRRP
jgi:DUF4097 and DUF4098 domain-containing protein YvlB